MNRALLLFLLLAGCAHHEVSLNAGTSSVSGTRVVSGGAGLQVNADGGGGVAALVAAGLIAAAVHDLRAPQRAPEMDPGRSVSEQDCSQPIDGTGNLRCK